MLYPVIIDRPYKDGYGSKIAFKLPQKVDYVRSVAVGVKNIIDLEDHIFPLPVNFFFNLYELSLIMNNEQDQVITDVVGRQAIFGQLYDWNGGLPEHIFKHYNTQMIIVNKSVIKNAQHHAVFKMPDDMIDYIGINTYTQEFGDYIKDNLQLIMYVDAN